MIIKDRRISWKKLNVWLALILCGLIAVYLGFIGFVSICVGASYHETDGFWVPIVAGFTLATAVLWLYYRLLKLVRHRRKEDIMNI